MNFDIVRMIASADMMESTFENAFGAFYHRYELPVLTAFHLVFLVAIVILVYAVAVRRTLRKTGKLIEKLPGRIGVVNSREKILFYKEQENASAQYSMLQDIPEIDYETISAAFRQVFLSKKPMVVDYECESVKRSLSISYIEKGLFHEDAVVWFSHDNTELQKARKEAESYSILAKMREELLATITQNMPVIFYAKDMEFDQRYIMANPAFCKYTGRNEYSIIGKNDFEIFPDDIAQKTRAVDIEVVRSGKAARSVETTQDHLGKTHTLQTIRLPYQSRDRHRLVLGVVTDVTELIQAQKLAEENAEKLQRQMELWDQLIHMLPIHIFAKDPDNGFRYLFCNRSMQNFFGLPENVLKEKDKADLFEAETLDQIREFDASAFKKQGDNISNTIRLPDRNGKSRFFRTVKRLVRQNNGSSILLGAGLDITEQIDAENDLRDLLAQHSLILENIPTYVFIKDIENDFRYVTCNNFCTVLLQCTKEHILGKTDSEIFPKETADAILREDMEAVKSGKEYRCEGSFPDCAGKLHYGTYYRKVVVSSRTAKKLLFVMVTDETELRKSQETMALWSRAVNSIPNLFFVKDPENAFHYVVCNNAFAESVGRTPEDIAGKTDADLYPGMDARVFLEKDMEAMRNDGHAIEFEEDVSFPDGTVRSYKTVKQPFTGIHGRRFLLAASTDISDLHHRAHCEKVYSNALAAAVAEQKFDIIVDKILQAVFRETGADRVEFAEVTQEGKLRIRREHFNKTAAPNSELRAMRYAAWDKFLTWQIRKSILTLSDVRDSSFFESLLRHSAYRTKSFLAAPVFVNGKLVGALFISYLSVRKIFNDFDVEFMESMANITALAQIRSISTPCGEDGDLEKR